jgi:hypothetical protein
MGHRAEHVGNVAALFHEAVENFADFRRNSGTIKARDSGHDKGPCGAGDIPACPEEFLFE